jgi:NDP-4-keto-2,6-dideoxyhexose 3-C-methyltransferase
MIIEDCRICGNRELLPILDLGPQALSGVFLPRRDENIPKIPLELVKCGPDGCGLVQLRHTADFEQMYEGVYGYRSSIRPFMVNHLQRKVATITGLVEPERGDLLLDIGSNDATLLKHYPADGPTLVGIDPNGEQFRADYPEHVTLIPDFFTKKAFVEQFGARRARAVTSIAMFYDLPRPLDFVQDVYDVLDDDGVWMLEHSYLPSMLATNGYDNICHEHLEFYAFKQIEWMASQVGFTVIRADLTDVYGGSLCTIMAKRPDRYGVDEQGVGNIRQKEIELGMDTMAPYEAFGARVREHPERLRDFLDSSRRAGKLTLGYGASTKGNVILQHCGITADDLPVIGEVNADKHGWFTPGTWIPIVSEEEAKERRPDQLLVLPWMHRAGFLEREGAFLAGGGSLVFPLPELDIVRR